MVFTASINESFFFLENVLFTNEITFINYIMVMTIYGIYIIGHQIILMRISSLDA